MIDSMTVWLNEASRYPLLSKTEIIELARLRDKFEPGSKKYIKVVNTICKHNLKLVHRTVVKYLATRAKIKLNSPVAMDLLQQGFFGLRRAAEKYDPERGFTFSTYAINWIRQSVSRYAAVHEELIYVPEATVRELFYQQRHGKPSERASATLNNELVKKAARARSIGSLDVRIGNENDDASTLMDMIGPENLLVDKTSEVEPQDKLAPIKDLMDQIGIKSRDQEIVLQYTRRGRMSIVASKLGLSPKHCQNLYQEIVRKMKAAVAAKSARAAARLVK